MADILAFPPRAARYSQRKVVGTRAGITVRILSGSGSADDLIVVLGGTADGGTTVAAIPAGEEAFADVVGHAVLAALDAADQTWSTQTSVS